MSRSVVFNGATLIVPGAASKLDVSAFNTAIISGLGIVALVGEADGGEGDALKFFSTPKEVLDFYRSGDLVDAANILGTPGNDPRIPGSASGIYCYNICNSIQSSLTVFDDSGVLAADAVFILNALHYGYAGNSITADITPSGSTILSPGTASVDVTLAQTLNGVTITETQTLATPKFRIYHSAPSTVAIDAEKLVITITAGPVVHNFYFASHPTVGELVDAIRAKGMTVDEVSPSALGTPTQTLGYPAAVPVLRGIFEPKAAITIHLIGNAQRVYSINYDIVQWVNSFSALASAQFAVQMGQVGTSLPDTTSAPLTGGLKGVANNTRIDNAIIALAGVEINQVIPLVSADYTSVDGAVSQPITMEDIQAKFDAHAIAMNSTTGKKERHIWYGVSTVWDNASPSGLTGAANVAAFANLSNNEHITVTCNKLRLPKGSTGSLAYLSEWSSAVAMAGMRAGADIGEPLTYKYVRALGLQFGTSTDPLTPTQMHTLLLNGFLLLKRMYPRAVSGLLNVPPVILKLKIMLSLKKALFRVWVG